MTHEQIQQLIPPNRDMDAYQQAWVTLLEAQLETEDEARTLLKQLEYRLSNHRRSDRKRSHELEDVPATSDSTSHEVHLLLNELPVEMRDLIRFMYVDGLTKKQSAAILGISQPTFRRKHDAAILFLRKIAPIFHF